MLIWPYMPKKLKILLISCIAFVLACGVVAYLFTAGDTITRDGKVYKKDSSYIGPSADGTPRAACDAIAPECGVCVKTDNLDAKTIVENSTCYLPL